MREVRTTGRPIAYVAKNLGTHKEALSGWGRQAEADAGECDDRLTTAEHEDLKQLRITGLYGTRGSSGSLPGPRLPERLHALAWSGRSRLGGPASRTGPPAGGHLRSVNRASPVS
ncbi:hypothetical protein AB0N36_44490 [Streptomyces acidicola]